MRVIVNADDFGYSHGINYGIIDAHRYGVLSSTTLMVNMPGTEHAVELMRKFPELGVGLHLNFALGRPMTEGKSLIGTDGKMIKPRSLSKDHSYIEEDIFKELIAQYERFLDLTGKEPSHLDSHLFTTDKICAIATVVKDFARSKNLPVRNMRINNYERVKFICHHNFGLKADLRYLHELESEIFKYDIIEIMVHPGYVDQFLLDNSSYALERAQETKILCGPEIRSLFTKHKVELITYNDIKEY